MSLDLACLDNARQRGGKFVARCPACAEAGSDRAGEHLAVYTDGRFACVQFQGAAGELHRQRIFELAGIKQRPGKPVLPRYIAPRAPIKPKPPLRLSSLRKLTAGEMAAIAHLRGWPMFAGLELLSQRGLLWYGEVYDAGQRWPAWIITDSARRNAQARRLDGQPWQGIRNAKAKTLPGADASWPIGAPDIGERPFVMLCEGQPDFCAALLVAWFEGHAIPGFNIEHVAPVCLTGAGQIIHPEALRYFAGKHVRISIHADAEGWGAAYRWKDQLYRAGAKTVDGFDFTGLVRPDCQTVKDLADFAQLLDPESLHEPDYLPEVCALADLPESALESSLTQATAVSLI